MAGDAREHARRVEEEELIRSRKEKLEQEAKAATEKFEEIVKKWETANSKWIPQELHEVNTHGEPNFRTSNFDRSKNTNKN